MVVNLETGKQIRSRLVEVPDPSTSPGKVYAAVMELYRLHGRSPVWSELMLATGLSRATIHKMVHQLLQQRLLLMEAGSLGTLRPVPIG